MAEIIDLHEYFRVCPQCGCIWCAIQYTTDGQVMQLICQDCEYIQENPELVTEPEVCFELDFELD